MRLDEVTISEFKNLRDLYVDFDEGSSYTVLVGENGAGKSNLIEALSLIFRNLDLDLEAPFSYHLKYQCREYDVEVRAAAIVVGLATGAHGEAAPDPAPAQGMHKVERHGQAMGTAISVYFWTDDDAKANQAADAVFAEMKRLQVTVETAIRKDPDVTGVVSVIGVSPMNASPNAGRLAITLRSRDERKTPVTTIMERLQREVATVPGVVVYFQPVQDIQISTRMSRAQYPYTLTGTDVQEVDDWASKLAQKLRTSAIMQDVASEAQNDGFRLDVQVDRDTAGRLGISMQTIVDTLSDAFCQRQISTIYGQANQYRVILEAKPEYQNDPNSLSKIYIPATGLQAVAQSTSLTSTSPTNIPTVGNNSMVPLSAVASFEHGTAPLVIAHQEQFPAATISFNLAPDAALSDADVRNKLAQAGVTPSPGTPEEFARDLAQEIARWGALIRAKGIKGE